MNNYEDIILLIEDDVQMRRFLRIAIENEQYRLLEADTAKAGLTIAASWNPVIVLLDLGLPDMEGIEVIKRLREWSKVPVIIISARDQEHDKVRALDAGADDYLTKPFGVGELLARIRVAIRHKMFRESGQEECEFVAENLHIDYSRRQVFLDNVEIHLTPIEYRLLTVLTQHAGKVLTHRQLLKEVWGPSHVDQSQYLRVYMTQLRHKIEKEPARPRFLINEPGIGYRFKYDPGR
jgi:two-component system, OmpR family, KDP operon response regulator KdpE